jgi:histidinol-phosphate aminotransferase
MGLLDYYRQFEGLSDEEVSAKLRAQAEERRRRALARIEAIDLSKTTWFEFPHPDVVNAVTFAIRRGINRPADPHAAELRHSLAQRLAVEPERLVIGNGAAQLLSSAAAALLVDHDHELITPWPSYPLYPLMARNAGGRAVPVGGFDPEALLEAVGPRTRALVLCNPNDPTGAHLPATRLSELLARLPEYVTVLLDEALIDFVDDEPGGASLALLDDHPRLLIFRTFSKAYGLAGLRVGYAVGAPGTEPLLERMEPPLGVSEPAQSGALEALEVCGAQVAARRGMVIAERARLLDALAELPVDGPSSQANFLWLRAPGISGLELAARLRRGGVIVAPGAAVGADDYIRVAVQSRGASERLVEALRGAAGGGDGAGG